MMIRAGHCWDKGNAHGVLVYVLAVLIGTASLALAEGGKPPDPASPGAPSSGEEIQERGLRQSPVQPGLPTPPRTATPVPFICSTHLCVCYNAGDCFNMGQAGVCVPNTINCDIGVAGACSCTLKQF
jgi:hypothetical protein